MHTITLDTASLDLARRAIIGTAASDTRHAAEFLEQLGDAAWPVSAFEVEDAQATLRKVLKSWTAIDSLGWPIRHAPSR